MWRIKTWPGKGDHIITMEIIVERRKGNKAIKQV